MLAFVLRSDKRLRSDNELLSTGEAAAIAGVSTETIRSWVRHGRLQARRLSNGWRIYHRGEVERVARERHEAVPFSVDGRAAHRELGLSPESFTASIEAPSAEISARAKKERP